MRGDQSRPIAMPMFMIALLSLATPAVIRGQCADKQAQVIRRGDVGTLDAQGIKHITIRVDVNENTKTVVQAAVTAWNGQQATTKIHFDVVDSGNANYVFEQHTTTDECADTYAQPESPPARTWLTDQFVSGVGEAYGANGSQTQKDALIKLIEHEMGHFLVLAHRPNSIMFQYTDEANTDCLQDLVNALPSWPSNLDGDAAKVPGCVFGADPNDPVVATGGDPEPRQVVDEGGPHCNIYNGFVSYDCVATSTNDSASVTCTEISWTPIGDPISSCDGGPPDI